MLYVAAPSTLGEDARVIWAFDNNPPVSIQSMMDVHAPMCVVNIGTGTIGSRTDHAAIRSVYFMTTRWRRMTSEGP